jgi:hypothetical protein
MPSGKHSSIKNTSLILFEYQYSLKKYESSHHGTNACDILANISDRQYAQVGAGTEGQVNNEVTPRFEVKGF